MSILYLLIVKLIFGMSVICKVYSMLQSSYTILFSKSVPSEHQRQKTESSTDVLFFVIKFLLDRVGTVSTVKAVEACFFISINK